MKKSFITNTIEETQKAGENLALRLCSGQAFPIKSGQAVVIGLIGDLGSAKTTFLQGFARGLGIKEKILSPTFVIYKKFSIFNFKFSIKSQLSNFQNFYHFDCYRINNSEEVLELGFKEIISNPRNIVAIEWPEKIKDVLPKNTIFIRFRFLDEQKREIIFE